MSPPISKGRATGERVGPGGVVPTGAVAAPGVPGGAVVVVAAGAGAGGVIHGQAGGARRGVEPAAARAVMAASTAARIEETQVKSAVATGLRREKQGGRYSAAPNRQVYGCARVPQ